MWIFAVNEKSGGGRGRKAWRIVEAELKQRGVPYTAVLAASPEEACREIAGLLERYSHPSEDGAHSSVKAVAVIGGDGTIHSILPVLQAGGVPLGIIPAGSGNDTARAFRLPKRPLEALRILLQGSPVPIDLIALRSPLAPADMPARPVLTALAAGFDSAIAAAVNRSAHKKLCNAAGVGSFAYVIGLFQVLLTYRPCPMSVTVDGVRHDYSHGWMAAVCNVSAYGGGLRICPDASPSDGLLDVCVVHSCTPLQLLRLFPTLLQGTHVRLPYVTLLRGRAISVEAQETGRSSPIAVYGDGEPAGQLPLYAEAAGNRIFVLR
ncbi:diacylglycerol kinase family protein [Paenibacillus sp. R14(2021)]|uniref:diacylglycerol/lipid kinase family protein n=1 Tax=Paenibacillus sp. R14(2021) TaxID=2859228 RepID=UPI001C612282|nr:diacylglycerol kinase family protein [Paenibacillus sp. R14(2021)]